MCFPDHQLRTNIRVFIYFSTIVWHLSPCKFFFLWIKIGKLLWRCFFLSCVVSHSQITMILPLASWRIYGPNGNIPALLQESVNSLKSLPAAPSMTASVPHGQPTLPRPPYLGQSFGMSRTWKKPVPSYVRSRKRLVPPPLGDTCSTDAQFKGPGKSTSGPLASPSFLPVYPWKALCPRSPGRSHSPCSGLEEGVFSQVASVLWLILGPTSWSLFLPSATVIPRWLASSVYSPSQTFLIPTRRFSFYLELRGDATHSKKCYKAPYVKWQTHWKVFKIYRHLRM